MASYNISPIGKYLRDVVPSRARDVTGDTDEIFCKVLAEKTDAKAYTYVLKPTLCAGDISIHAACRGGMSVAAIRVYIALDIACIFPLI